MTCSVCGNEDAWFVKGNGSSLCSECVDNLDDDEKMEYERSW